MASSLMFTAIPAGVARPSSAHADVRSARRLAGPPPRAASANWWAPLFGWSPEPDYIDDAGKPSETKKDEAVTGEKAEAAAAVAGVKRRRMGRTAPRRFALFTEEKAKELRMRTMEMDAFHNDMYHSAIATRLASDVPRRPPAAPNTTDF